MHTEEDLTRTRPESFYDKMTNSQLEQYNKEKYPFLEADDPRLQLTHMIC
jgi:hypothetical protein